MDRNLHDEAQPKDVEKKKKTIHSCMGCLLFILLFGLILFLGVGTLIAKTGLVNVGFLTDSMYTEPVPEHEVEIRSNDELLDQVNNKIVHAIMQEQPMFSISSEELTYLLQNVHKDDKVSVRQIQGYITDTDIELYIDMQEPVDGIFIVNAIPIIKQDALHIDITRVQVGQVTIPIWMVRNKIDSFLNDALKDLVQDIGVPTNILLEDNRLTIMY